jgi:hypothetical protein
VKQKIHCSLTSLEISFLRASVSPKSISFDRTVKTKFIITLCVTYKRNFKLFVPYIFSTYGMKTNWCHYFIRILLDLYMFRAHRPIFRRVRTAVHTTIGSVSVPFCSRALCFVACLGDYSWLWVENSHQDRPQDTEHANRAAQKLNQRLCEQLHELSWRWACGLETCRDPAIYE